MMSRIGIAAIIVCFLMIISCQSLNKPQQPYVFPAALHMKKDREIYCT